MAILPISSLTTACFGSDGMIQPFGAHPNGSGVYERGDARSVDLPFISNAKFIPWSSRRFLP